MTNETAANCGVMYGDETGDEMVATALDVMAATGVIMYTDEGEYEFGDDEMAALEGQRLVTNLDAEFSCGFVSRRLPCECASELAGNPNETTVNRKRSLSRMMMKAWRIV